MNEYEVWFQDSQCLIVINARDAKEARNDFNRMLKFKRRQGLRR